MKGLGSIIKKVWIVSSFVVMIAFYSQNAVGQEGDDPPMRILYPCQIKIKARGAEFAYSYLYWVTTAASGKAATVTPSRGETRLAASKFVDEAAFVECIKKWTLEPNSKYIVQFVVSTMSLGNQSEPRNFVLISGPGQSGQRLKMELPWSIEDTLVIPEKKKETMKSKRASSSTVT